MRAVGGRIAFAGQGARQLADAGRVEDAPVDLRGRGIKAVGECLEDALHHAALVSREVEPVKQVVAVAAVGEDRRGPAAAAEVVAHGPDHPQGLALLAVGG